MERGLEQWVDSLEEVLKIIEEQNKLRSTIHYKGETCCDKIQKVLKSMKKTKEIEIIIEE